MATVAPYIPEVGPLLQTLTTESLKFNRALRATNVEALAKRPPKSIEREAIELMGGYWEGAQRYLAVEGEIFRLRKPVKPEIILMWSTFEDQKRAYMAGYRLMGLLMEWFADQMGLEAFSLTDPQFSKYLGLSRVGFIRGEQRVSHEEKSLLQVIVYGNLAGMTPEEVEPVFNLGLESIKLGFLTETMNGAFIDLYNEVDSRFWKPIET